MYQGDLPLQLNGRCLSLSQSKQISFWHCGHRKYSAFPFMIAMNVQKGHSKYPSSIFLSKEYRREFYTEIGQVETFTLKLFQFPWLQEEAEFCIRISPSAILDTFDVGSLSVKPTSSGLHFVIDFVPSPSPSAVIATIVRSVSGAYSDFAVRRHVMANFAISQKAR